MQKTGWAFLICCILASCSIVSMSNESQRLGLDVGSGEVSDNKEAEDQDEDIILSSAVIATIVKKSGEYKVEKNIFGDTEIRSRGGSKTTIEKDIFGNTIIKDSKGNKTTVEKDIFGNIIIKSN